MHLETLGKNSGLTACIESHYIKNTTENRLLFFFLVGGKVSKLLERKKKRHQKFKNVIKALEDKLRKFPRE